MEIVRTVTYEKGLKRLRKLGATLRDIDTLEEAIAADPRSGQVIQGTGGLRKLRFAFGAAGKSGGGRTVYYALSAKDRVYMIAAYAKVDKSDITADEKRLFKTLVKELTDD